MPKHVTNQPKTLVNDALAGLAFVNPALTIKGTTAILRDLDKDKVSLVCGGGSGHEPAHAAFVGKGMLSAAVCGQVFASPNAKQVEQALSDLSLTKGTLIVTKNYTGDVLQFGLAKERWTATHLGQDNVRMLVVGDDVAVSRDQGKLTGRRGLAATTIVYKVAGALANQQASIDEVEHVAKLVAHRSGTIGFGLEHCHVPGTDAGEAYLKDNELEIGMGIHNEPGVRKVSPLPSSEKLVNDLLTTLTATDDEERSYLDFKHDGKDEVILMVNNLGGLAELELSAVTHDAAKWLAAKRISVERVISGSFMSSLNLPGASLTLVLLPREPVSPSFDSKLRFDKDLILDLFDAPTEAPGWRWSAKQRPELQKEDTSNDKGKTPKTKDDQVKGPAPVDKKLFKDALDAALKSVIKAEPEITKYDTIAGDGDAGLTLKAGAEAVQGKMASLNMDDVVAAMVSIGEVAENDMGGTSGGLYSIFMSALAKGLLTAADENKQDKATAEVWARALELALNTLYQYTRARPPSRTLVDPLAAFVITFGSDPQNFNNAFDAAKEATEATKDLEAKAGRAAYVDKDVVKDAAVPDAGAVGVLKLLEGVKSVLDGVSTVRPQANPCLPTKAHPFTLGRTASNRLPRRSRKMAIKTYLTETLGIKYPVVCAGMMHIGEPALVSAASEAGGLGVLTGLNFGSPQGLREKIRETRSLTSKPFAVNLTFLPAMTPPPYEEYAQVIIDEGVKITETAGGPAAAPVIKMFKKAGIFVIHKSAVKLGVDMLSIDGFECAGHPGEDDVGGLVLLALAAKHLNVPYIASGGIGNGRGLAAALALGACGVNCGTLFMATEESYIHPKIKQAIVAATERDTTHIFRTLHNTARVFKNKIAVEVVEKERRPGGVEFKEIAPLVSGARGKLVYDNGDVDAGVWSASPVVGLIDKVQSCKSLLQEMERDAEEILLQGAKMVTRESKL
ncbi:hypothetical protein OIO90_000844 [Microbotryomycetes sp. JL221]|nr:hypothetical protein OIO90_000844 [Microbotryomycetes sp. JL221]